MGTCGRKCLFFVVYGQQKIYKTVVCKQQFRFRKIIDPNQLNKRSKKERGLLLLRK